MPCLAGNLRLGRAGAPRDAPPRTYLLYRRRRSRSVPRPPAARHRPPPSAPSPRCLASSRARPRTSCRARPQSRCPRPRDRASHRGPHQIVRTFPFPPGYPRGVVVALGVELDQGLGRLASHLVADAGSPDRLPLGVELEVAVGRFAVVGAHDVYLGLRLGPKPLAGGEVERRETHPPTVDPPSLRAPYTDLSEGASNHRITRPVLPSTRTRFFCVLLGPAKLPAISTSSP